MTNTNSPQQVLLGHGWTGRMEKVDLSSVMQTLNYDVEAFHAFTAYLTKQKAVWFEFHNVSAVLAPLSSGLLGQMPKDIIRSGKAMPLREAMHDIQLVNMYTPVWQLQVNFLALASEQAYVEAEDEDEAFKIAEKFFLEHLQQANYAKRKKILAGMIQDTADHLNLSYAESIADCIAVDCIDEGVKQSFLPPDYDASQPLEDPSEQ